MSVGYERHSRLIVGSTMFCIQVFIVVLIKGNPSKICACSPQTSRVSPGPSAWARNLNPAIACVLPSYSNTTTQQIVSQNDHTIRYEILDLK